MIAHNNRLQIRWLVRSLEHALVKKSILAPGISREAIRCSNRKQTGNENNGKSRTDDVFPQQKAKSEMGPPKVSENCLVLRKTLSRQNKIFGFDDNSTNFLANILGKLSKIYFAPKAPTIPPSFPECQNSPSKMEICPPASPPGGNKPPKPKYPPCPDQETSEPKSKCSEKSKYPPCPSKITPESRPKCPPEKASPCADKKMPESKPTCPPQEPPSCSEKTPEPKCPPCSDKKISKPKCSSEESSPCPNKKNSETMPKCPQEKPSPCSNQKTPETKPICPPEKSSPCSSRKIIEKSKPPAKCPNNSEKSRECPPCPPIKKYCSLLQLPMVLGTQNRSYSCSKSGNTKKGKCRTSKGASNSGNIVRKKFQVDVDQDVKSVGKLRKVCIKRCRKNRRGTNDFSQKSRKL